MNTLSLATVQPPGRRNMPVSTITPELLESDGNALLQALQEEGERLREEERRRQEEERRQRDLFSAPLSTPLGWMDVPPGSPAPPGYLGPPGPASGPNLGLDLEDFQLPGKPQTAAKQVLPKSARMSEEELLKLAKALSGAFGEGELPINPQPMARGALGLQLLEGNFLPLRGSNFFADYPVVAEAMRDLGLESLSAEEIRDRARNTVNEFEARDRYAEEYKSRDAERLKRALAVAGRNAGEQEAAQRRQAAGYRGDPKLLPIPGQEQIPLEEEPPFDQIKRGQTPSGPQPPIAPLGPPVPGGGPPVPGGPSMPQVLGGAIDPRSLFDKSKDFASNLVGKLGSLMDSDMLDTPGTPEEQKFQQDMQDQAANVRKWGKPAAGMRFENDLGAMEEVTPQDLRAAGFNLDRPQGVPGEDFNYGFAGLQPIFTDKPPTIEEEVKARTGLEPMGATAQQLLQTKAGNVPLNMAFGPPQSISPTTIPPGLEVQSLSVGDDGKTRTTYGRPPIQKSPPRDTKQFDAYRASMMKYLSDVATAPEGELFDNNITPETQAAYFRLLSVLNRDPAGPANDPEEIMRAIAAAFPQTRQASQRQAFIEIASRDGLLPP